MKRSVLLLLLISISAIIFAAPQTEPATAKTTATSDTDYFAAKSSVEYSSVFEIEYFGNYKIITVSEPWPGADSGTTYLLVQRGTTAPAGIDADMTIEVPVESIVSTSTSYLPQLVMLGELDTLVAVDAVAYISSEEVNAYVAGGSVKEVGSGSTVNVEVLIDLDPDLIMTYGMGNEWDTHPKLDEVGLPYVLNAEWNEMTPLGRAEWIKFIAAFYNKEAEANRIFDSIVQEYESLSALAAKAPEKPTVFAGAPYQGTWWMSGGASYAAQFFKDAGADYLWSEDTSTGSLMLDIETVYETAGEADYWLNTSYWGSLADAAAADERFTKFAAYKTGAIFNYNKRMGPGGGNDYFESAPAMPHVLLADLIYIFHPELLPDHELYYYTKLE